MVDSKSISHSQAPFISVIIASYNSRPHIKRCLDSLYRQKTTHTFEVIVADSSNDGTFDFIQENYPEIKLIQLPHRTFPGPARNAAIAHAAGVILSCVDSDCIVAPDWIEFIAESQRSGMNIVGGVILNGTPESYSGTAQYLMEFSEYMPQQSNTTLRMIPTCNLSFQRSIFELIGGFESIEKNGHLFKSEDLIFCYRAQQKGLQIYFNARMKVKHLNKNKIKNFFSNQYSLGYSSALARRHIQMHGSVILKYPPLFLFIPFIKTIRVGVRLLLYGLRPFFHYVKHFPFIVLGSCTYAAGFYAGWKIDISDEPSDSRK